MKQLPYDRTSKESIEEYGKGLVSKTFKEILDNNPYLEEEEKKKIYEKYNNPKNKGSLGNFIEENYFFYKSNTKSEADFNEAGVELKVTPYLNKNGKKRQKERLVLGKINYCEHYNEEFFESHLYSKCALMLLVYYLHDYSKKKMDFKIDYVKLFNFSKEDLEIIKQDYYFIMDKIKQGKAHELSESDTNYLGACSKAATKENYTKQPFSDIMAKPRAYCLKIKYMDTIFKKYILNDSKMEPLIKNSDVLKSISLEEYVINKLSQYYNYDEEYLKRKFNVSYNSSNKAFAYYLAKGMLNIVGDKIEEFEKANISVKAIRINKNGKIEQHMSFPTFKYMDIVNQEWEESDLYETFSTTKFLFIIFEYNNENKMIFKKSMFWNVPSIDLDNEIKKVWLETKKRIINNEYNSLPRTKESEILHVRPHGNAKSKPYPTPDGKGAKPKCFWLRREYILKQIKSEDF